MVNMASGIALGRVHTTAATTVESRNMAATGGHALTETAPSVCSRSVHVASFLCGIFKEKKNIR